MEKALSPITHAKQVVEMSAIWPKFPSVSFQRYSKQISPEPNHSKLFHNMLISKILQLNYNYWRQFC